MVFVKTVVYHALSTLMPYPSEDPSRLLGLHFLIGSCFISVLVIAFPVGREASITYKRKQSVVCLLQ